MKNWLHATKKEIENMTLEEAIELIMPQIEAGEAAKTDPSKRDFAPRAHYTQALKIVVNKALENNNK